MEETKIDKQVKLAHKVADIVMRIAGALMIVGGCAVMIYPFIIAPKERIREKIAMNENNEPICIKHEIQQGQKICVEYQMEKHIEPIPLSERGWPECLVVGIPIMISGIILHIYSVKIYKTIALKKLDYKYELDKLKLTKGAKGNGK